MFNNICIKAKRCVIYKRGPRQWSRLQSALYGVIDGTTGFQLHCCAYDTGECVPLPRYWVTIGKEVVWDFPKDAMWDDSDWTFSGEASNISRLIRDYVDCPRGELLSRTFDDRWQLLPYLQACDRRIGKRRLVQLLERPDYACVAGIIRKRLCNAVSTAMTD